MLKKLGNVADYEGCSVNSHVLAHESIRAFEAEHDKIEGSISADLNFKPAKKE